MNWRIGPGAQVRDKSWTDRRTPLLLRSRTSRTLSFRVISLRKGKK